MQRQKYKEKINSARKSRKSLEDILLMINFSDGFINSAQPTKL
jgi:hypothetical protein